MSVFFKEKIKNPLIFFGFVLLFLIILLFILLLTQKVFDSKMEQSVKLFIQKNYQQEFVYDSLYTKKIQSAVEAKIYAYSIKHKDQMHLPSDSLLVVARVTTICGSVPAVFYLNTNDKIVKFLGVLDTQINNVQERYCITTLIVDSWKDTLLKIYLEGENDKNEK